jgi:hypothetical protein
VEACQSSGKGEDPAIDFTTRRFDGLARFFGDQRGKLFAPLANAAGNGSEDALLFKAGEFSCRLKSTYGRGDGRVRVRRASPPRAADNGVIERREDIEPLAIGHPFPIDVEGPVFYRKFGND